MNIKYVTIDNLTEIDKLRFIKFIFENTNSFILNTFGHTWSGRDAYTVNDKYEDSLKTYYIVTSKDSRGQGIAKLLIKNAIYKNKDKISFYYVNSDTKSEGAIFYKKWLGKNFTLEDNDFNSQDIIFKEPIYNIIDEV